MSADRIVFFTVLIASVLIQSRVVTVKNVLFQFPGQGSQYRGMGSDLVPEFPSAAGIYEQASTVLGYDVAELSFEDPNDDLSLTRYTQPALLTHQVACLAAFRALTDDTVKPVVAAGHSLGEYTALVAAGALTLETALKLVAERGRLMSELGQGSMLATTLDAESARILADKHFCGVAGCNLPEQTVVAGEDDDLAALAADLKQNYRGKRAVELKTEGAFHTYLMVAAAQEFRAVLMQTEIGALGFDVLSNYTGQSHIDDPGAIRSRLFFQLFSPVRWVDCMKFAVQAGVDAIVEFGGGIGAGDSPAEKRANLESVAKKSLKWLGHEAQYCAAINVAGIRAAADQLTNH